MAEVNGKALAVELQGSGDAVVMVHGLGGTTNTYGPQAGPLSRFFTVLRFDLPGSGRSPLAGPLSIPGFADDVVALMQANGIARAHLVGHPMGTIVCQHVAASHPKLVRSLALFGPLIAPTDAARIGIRARAGKLRSEGAAGMQEVAQTLMNAAISADTRQRNPAAAAFVRESLMRQDPDGYARSCDALAEAKAAALERIEAPTLLLTGDEDTVAPPQAVRAMAERLGHVKGGARAVVFSRCGHWTPIERPEECARDLRGFLDAQR